MVQNIQDSQLAFDINPLKYCYGFPLFVALSIASNSLWEDKLLQIISVFLISLLFQIWGVGFDVLRHLLFEFNGVYAVFFDYSSIQINLISLASQLGFLIFPSLIPILLWAYFYKDFIGTIINK